MIGPLSGLEIRSQDLYLWAFVPLEISFLGRVEPGPELHLFASIKRLRLGRRTQSDQSAIFLDQDVSRVRGRERADICPLMHCSEHGLAGRGGPCRRRRHIVRVK